MVHLEDRLDWRSLASISTESGDGTESDSGTYVDLRGQSRTVIKTRISDIPEASVLPACLCALCPCSQSIVSHRLSLLQDHRARARAGRLQRRPVAPLLAT